MGTMVTSCMNGESDPMVRNTYFYRVKSGGIFSPYVFEAGKNAAGKDVTLTATNIIKDFDAPEDHIALVNWQYDSSLQEVNNNTENINVEVLGAQDITFPFSVAESKGEAGDISSNAPIMTLEPNGANPAYYDSENLILMIGHKAESDLSKHKFTLVYLKTPEVNEEKVANEEGTMKLYLRHVTSEDLEKETKNGLSYCAFNFSEALVSYKAANGGKNPVKIVVVAKENSISNKLDDASTKDKEYSLEYKFED